MSEKNYHLRKDQIRSEVRTTKEVKLKDGSKAHETSIMKVGAGKNPTVMLAPYKKELKNVDKVVIQLESKKPFKATITDARAVERGRGRPKS